MAAPAGMQPGDYVPSAYGRRFLPATPIIKCETSKKGEDRLIVLSWLAMEPVALSLTEPDRFADSAALLVPETAASPLITMGVPGAGVSGVLWRNGWDRPICIKAAGLGTVVREPAPVDWRAQGSYAQGRWRLEFHLHWPLLETMQQFGVAVWQGAQHERAGLKSITPGWVELR